MADRHPTLPHALRDWAAATPDRIALTEGDREVDYRSLADLVERRAAWMAVQGVGVGDRVVVLGYNSIGWVVAYLAVLRLGAIVVPVNNRLTPYQVAELVALLEPKLVLADARHREMLAESRAVPLDLESEPRVGGSDSARPLPTGELDALISFTSGTTGKPKGAVLSQAALCTASATFRTYFATTADDSTLVLAAMFHNTGFVDQLGQMLIAGGRTDLLREFHRREAIEAFSRRPTSFVTAVPSVLRMLMLHEEADRVFGPARIALFGGSPMPRAWSQEMLRRWPHIGLYHGYGLTEFGSACSFLPPELVVEYGESVGYPAPEVSLRIAGDDGEDVAAGEVGEIWVSGPSRMSRYWRRPEATEEKLSGGWLRTGDLGYLGERNLLYLMGRRDDVINRGGEKILPSHLESILSERVDVGSCVIVGVPDPVLQEVPVAALEPRPGHSFDEPAARALMAARLPAYALPQEFFVVQGLPRIASGKIDRMGVRAMIIETLERRQAS